MRLLWLGALIAAREHTLGAAEIAVVNASELTPEIFASDYAAAGRPVLVLGGAATVARAAAAASGATDGLGWLVDSALAALPVRVFRSGDVNTGAHGGGERVEPLGVFAQAASSSSGGSSAAGAAAAGTAGEYVFDDLTKPLRNGSGRTDGALAPFDRSGRVRAHAAAASADAPGDEGEEGGSTTALLRRLFAPPPFLGRRDECGGSTCARFLLVGRRGGRAQRHLHGEVSNDVTHKDGLP